MPNHWEVRLLIVISSKLIFYSIYVVLLYFDFNFLRDTCLFLATENLR